MLDRNFEALDGIQECRGEGVFGSFSTQKPLEPGEL